LPSAARPSPKAQRDDEAAPAAGKLTASGAPPSAAETWTVASGVAAEAAGAKLSRAAQVPMTRRASADCSPGALRTSAADGVEERQADPDPDRDLGCAPPRQGAPEREQLRPPAEPGDTPDDEGDHRVLDQVRGEGRPLVEDVGVRLPSCCTARVAESGEREDEPRPEDERRPHVSPATASGRGARAKRAPAARAACSSAPSSPMCSARAGGTRMTSSAWRIPAGSGLPAADTTVANTCARPCSASHLCKL